MSELQILKARLEELNHTPKRSLGQNFLIETAVIQKIVDAVSSLSFSQLIEIGPGLGAITEKLPQPVLLIEMDAQFSEFWRQKNFEVIEGDALKIDWNFLKPNACLVSNLPYQIAASLVIDQALQTEISHMILMFQKEVAQRIMAKPRTEDYGLLSVIAQLAFKVERVVDASPKCFYPAPNISSRVLKFSRIATLPPGFLKFTKVAFSHRRKKLINNLNVYGALDEVFAKLKISLDIRAEALTPNQFLMLYNEVL